MTSPFDTREIGLGPPSTAVSNILVVRPGGLGEMVNAVPALRHLRAVYPESQICVAAARDALQLVQACPYVDRTIELQAESEIESIAAGSVEPAFDLVVSFGDPYRPLAGRAAERFSLRLREIREVSFAAYRTDGEDARHLVHPVWPKRLSDAQRMLRLVWLLGGIKPDITLSLWPTLTDRNAAASLVSDIDAPLAIVHMGAKRAERRWPRERFARAIELLIHNGICPVVVGADADHTLVAQLRENTCATFVDVVGQTSVGQLAGLMERACLFFGNDSGPAALAAAMSLPSVIIGPGSAIERLGTSPTISYLAPDWCEVCGEAVCDHSSDAADVSESDALAELTILSQRAAGTWVRSIRR